MKNHKKFNFKIIATYFFNFLQSLKIINYFISPDRITI